MKRNFQSMITKHSKNLLLLICITTTVGTLCSCSQAQGQPFKARESSIFQAAEVKNCRITAKNLEVKSGAGEDFPTITTLNKGDEVRVLGKVDDWYVIRLNNYKIGCIDSSQTTPIVKEDPQPQDPQEPPQPERPVPEPEPDPPEQQPVEEPDEPESPGDTIPGAEPDTPAEPTEPEEPEETPAENPGLRAQASRLIELINQERRKNNLNALKVDPEVTRVAGIKAQDMVDNNYFSHYSPTYGSPFDMLDEFGVDYQYAGENIAQNRSAEQAHRALMNSSGHRRNILNPNFTHIGVGVRAKENRGYIYVELFTGVPR